MAKKEKVDRNLEELQKLESPLVIYAGPGISDAAGLPTRQELLEALVEEIEEEELASPKQLRELTELVEDGELTDAFTEAMRLMTPAMFNRAVEHQLDDEESDVPELAQAIANLGGRLRGVITPNLDHTMERAFDGQLTVYTQAKADLPASKNWLLKIHGTLKDRATWVFTAEQQGEAIYNNPLQQDVFRSLFFATPILFVGTSLDDPALEAVVERIRALSGGQPPKHYALLPKDQLSGTRKRKLSAAGISPIAFEDMKDCIAKLDSLAEDERAPRAPRARKEKARSPLSILFVAANPKGTDPLRLSNEVRLIRQAIERSKHRDYLQLEISMAATVHDLRRALLERPFEVVHISGHGGREGLMLENEQGEAVQVRKKSLARLLAAYVPPDGKLQCVILNACYSMSTGRRAAMDIPYTIAMDGPVGDDGALEFSRGFYDALGAGKDFPFAFEEGLRCVDLVAPDSTFSPLLMRAEEDDDDDDL